MEQKTSSPLSSPGSSKRQKEHLEARNKAVGLAGHLPADPGEGVLVKSGGAEKPGGSVLQPSEDWEEAGPQAAHPEPGTNSSPWCSAQSGRGRPMV